MGDVLKMEMGRKGGLLVSVSLMKNCIEKSGPFQLIYSKVEKDWLVGRCVTFFYGLGNAHNVEFLSIPLVPFAKCLFFNLTYNQRQVLLLLLLLPLLLMPLLLITTVRSSWLWIAFSYLPPEGDVLYHGLSGNQPPPAAVLLQCESKY